MSKLLRAALVRLASQRHIDVPEWAEKNERRIWRALQNAKDKKLRNRRYGEFTQPWRDRAQIPTPRLAAHLVECKTKERQWSAVLRKYSDEARAIISTRATEILGRAKIKARKNFTENYASKIAAELHQDWFSAAGKSGRPIGKRTHGDDDWLSLDEIVATVAPIIEEIADTKISGMKSTPFPALVSAVRMNKGHSARTEEFIARTLSRLKATPDADRAN